MENKSPFRSNSEFNIFDSGEDDEDTIEYTDKKKKTNKIGAQKRHGCVLVFR